MLKIALEGAGFITAFDRNSVVSIGVRLPEKLDEASARQIAVNQALGVVLSGSVQRQGSGYGIALKASRAMTDELIANVSGRASSKDQVLGVATRLASDVREALGDDTSDAAKQFATDRLSATSLDVARDHAAGTAGLHSNKPEEALRKLSGRGGSRSEIRLRLLRPRNSVPETWTDTRMPRSTSQRRSSI